MRPSFEAKIEEWRSRSRVADTFYDVFDGDMWREFVDRDGHQFVAEPRSLLLTLNVDWFGPFENSTYSCGAIYLTVNNLPRSERFKTENVILVGVMPGPREASTSDINHYLRPMVDELLEWYNGKRIVTAEHPDGVRVRLALLNVACDIPAARKVSGFTSHASRCGCHKCHRQFSVFPGTTNLDYSGFDMDNWISRTMEDNREHAEQWRHAETMGERRERERQNGTRWSELHRLQYFDPVRCTIVDPMHNLFLGTAKRMTKVWLSRGFLTDTDLQQMQVLADGILLPPDYVSLKRKIVSGQGFSYMTADDWKSWCIVYSPVVLDGHLERRYLENWLKFVDACRLMVKPSITIDEIQEAATLIHQFCTGVEDLYGPEEITPNMHLHMHLDVMIEDFGPLYAYWLFSFERYNGYLKEIDTNQKDSFEATFMKRFLQKTGARDFVRSFEALFQDHQHHFNFLNYFLDLVQPIPNTVNVIHHQFDPHSFFALSTNIQHAALVTGSEPLPPDTHPLNYGREIYMPEQLYSFLLQFYNLVYGQHFVHFTQAGDGQQFVSNRYWKMNTIKMMGQTYRSTESRSRRGAHVQVLFHADDRGEAMAWPCEIQFFFRHVQIVDGISKEHIFAYVRWYSIHGENDGRRYVDPYLEIWRSHFRAEDMTCIVPIHRLYGQVAIIKYNTETNANSRITIIPLPKKMLA